MLETLKKHLDNEHRLCKVGTWIDSMDEEHRALFKELILKKEDISIAPLHNDLLRENQMPYKLTAFRSHIRGYCTCR